MRYSSCFAIFRNCVEKSNGETTCRFFDGCPNIYSCGRIEGEWTEIKNATSFYSNGEQYNVSLKHSEYDATLECLYINNNVVEPNTVYSYHEESVNCGEVAGDYYECQTSICSDDQPLQCYDRNATSSPTFDYMDIDSLCGRNVDDEFMASNLFTQCAALKYYMEHDYASSDILNNEYRYLLMLTNNDNNTVIYLNVFDAFNGEHLIKNYKIIDVVSSNNIQTIKSEALHIDPKTNNKVMITYSVSFKNISQNDEFRYTLFQFSNNQISTIEQNKLFENETIMNNRGSTAYAVNNNLFIRVGSGLDLIMFDMNGNIYQRRIPNNHHTAQFRLACLENTVKQQSDICFISFSDGWPPQFKGVIFEIESNINSQHVNVTVIKSEFNIDQRGYDYHIPHSLIANNNTHQFIFSYSGFFVENTMDSVTIDAYDVFGDIMFHNEVYQAFDQVTAIKNPFCERIGNILTICIVESKFGRSAVVFDEHGNEFRDNIGLNLDNQYDVISYGYARILHVIVMETNDLWIVYEAELNDSNYITNAIKYSLFEKDSKDTETDSNDIIIYVTVGAIVFILIVVVVVVSICCFHRRKNGNSSLGNKEKENVKYETVTNKEEELTIKTNDEQ